MQTEREQKPVPHPGRVSLEYWDGTRRSQLLLQKCGNCGAVRHYPRPVCDRCYSLEVEWIEASGRGTVHSWTIAHHAYHPAFKAEVPYVLVTVDLEEGVRALGRLDGIGAEDLRLDLPVQVRMTPTENGFALLTFVPARPIGV